MINTYFGVLAPAPSPVMVSSSTPNPVRPIGSDVTLTCTAQVELSLAVDVPVTVNITLIGPAGFVATNNSNPIVIQGAVNFNSRAVISSFSRGQSGIYTCTATLSSVQNHIYIINSSAITDSIQVTIGEISYIIHLLTI